MLPGSYRLVVRATATTGERAVERRTVFVCKPHAQNTLDLLSFLGSIYGLTCVVTSHGFTGSSNESFCGVNFINEGVTVDKDCANVQFTSCGPVDSFRCKLNGGSFALCE